MADMYNTRVRMAPAARSRSMTVPPPYGHKGVTVMHVAEYVLESSVVAIALSVEGSEVSASRSREWTRLFWVESVVF